MIVDLKQNKFQPQTPRIALDQRITLTHCVYAEIYTIYWVGSYKHFNVHKAERDNNLKLMQ